MKIAVVLLAAGLAGCVGSGPVTDEQIRQGAAARQAKAAQTSIDYEGPKVFSGRVERLTAIDIVRGEEVAVQFTGLILDRRVTAVPAESDGMNRIVTTGIIHVAFADEQQRSHAIQAASGRATIHCKEIFSSHTAHHFAPIVCLADDITDISW